jgi:hypothetical protein
MRLIIIFLIFFSSCGPSKPDYVDNNGKEYCIRSLCVSSHEEIQYGYHYGFDLMTQQYRLHWGQYVETICDAVRIDTIEINKDEKYYK